MALEDKDTLETKEEKFEENENLEVDCSKEGAETPEVDRSEKEDLDKKEEKGEEVEEKMDEESTEEEEDETKEESKEEAEDKETHMEMEFETLKQSFADLQNQYNTVLAEKEAFVEKFEAMSDYEELKQFKFDYEQKEIASKRAAEINSVISEIELRGIKMSETEITDLTSKVQEFSNIDSWKNYVKAYVFDKIDSVESIGGIDIPNLHKPEPQKSSIWSK